MGYDWKEISAKLPSKRTPEQKAQRAELFNSFDPNGNGYLSLAEVDKGIRDYLKLDELFNKKSVIMRAFQAAKGASKGKSTHGPDYVEKNEFRLLLEYLRTYFELYAMFDDIDTGDDRRVDLNEFSKALGKIEKWGVKVDNAESEFKAVDKNGGGQILFDEFADWALQKKLDLEDDDD